MYVNYVCESASHWFIVALCFERFYALMWPLHVRSLQNSRNAARTCLFILALSVLLCAPVPVVFGERVHAAHGRLSKSLKIRSTCEAFGLFELGSYSRLWAALVIYITSAQKYAYSTILTLLLVGAIAIKLLCVRLRFRRERTAAEQRPATLQDAGLMQISDLH